MARPIIASLAVVAALTAGLWLFGGLLAGGKWSAIAVSVAWFFAVSAVAARVVRREPRLRLPVRGTFLTYALVASFAFYWTSIRTNEVDEAVAVPAAQIGAAEREAALRGDAAATATPTPTPTATPTPEATPAAAPEPRRERRRARKARATRAARAAATPAPTATASPTPTASPSPSPARDARLLGGRFSGADDHAGSGRATVIRRADGTRKLAFTDFDVDGGLDVRVYLVPGDGSSVDDHVELGRLKGERGDQQYTVPRNVDLSRYRTVVLYCIPYTVRVAVAPLR